MKEEEWRKSGNYNNQLKLALFFGGWPPLKPDLTGMMLADETDLQVPIATCHVSEYFPRSLSPLVPSSSPHDFETTSFCFSVQAITDQSLHVLC
jgi:hypothetical protein